MWELHPGTVLSVLSFRLTFTPLFFNILASLGMDGIFHKAGKVGMHYDCVCSAISKIWPARIRNLTVMGNEGATLYSAFSIYIQTLRSYLLLMSLHEYV